MHPRNLSTDVEHAHRCDWNSTDPDGNKSTSYRFPEENEAVFMTHPVEPGIFLAGYKNQARLTPCSATLNTSVETGGPFYNHRSGLVANISQDQAWSRNPGARLAIAKTGYQSSSTVRPRGAQLLRLIRLFAKPTQPP